MARLIIKHELSDVYVKIESRSALRSSFPMVLAESVAKSGQEIIFIDGLDQLEEEQRGERDLTFLPTTPSPGVVFVLGTRPNETLKGLEMLLQHHSCHELPDISSSDFSQILDHRRAPLLSKSLLTNLYNAMDKNALYLDLVAKELAKMKDARPEEIIERVSDNPDRIFTIAIDRLKKPENQWRGIIRRILGLLLVAQSPLREQHIREILNVDADILYEGLNRLRGLVVQDGQERNYLFHPKLQEYLRCKPDNEYVFAFAPEEEREWHADIVRWCETRQLEDIWRDSEDISKQEQRVYARYHYIAHLYLAEAWERLWDKLSDRKYGWAKIEHVSVRSYAQDLDLGRKAARREEWELDKALELLPHLWRYSLLRCSLASQTDTYSEEMFENMLMHGREEEAIGLAELLTTPSKKAAVFRRIVAYLKEKPSQKSTMWQLLDKAERAAGSIEDERERSSALIELAITMTDVGEEEKAIKVAQFIVNSQIQADALRQVAIKFATVGKKERALEAISRIYDKKMKDEALHNMAVQLMSAGETSQALNVMNLITDEAEQAIIFVEMAIMLVAKEREEAIPWFLRAEKIARSINNKEQRAEVLAKVFKELALIREWKRAEELAQSITEEDIKVMAMLSIVEALITLEEEEVAISLLTKADQEIRLISDSNTKNKVLGKFATANMQLHKLEQAEKAALLITDKGQRKTTMYEIVKLRVTMGKEEEIIRQAEEEIIEQAMVKDIEGKDSIITDARIDDEEALHVLAGMWGTENVQEMLAATRGTERILPLLLEAVEEAKKISGDSTQAKVLHTIVMLLVLEKSWAEASRISALIRNKVQKAHTMLAIAINLGKERERDEALHLLTDCIEVAYSIVDPQQKWYVFHKIIKNLILMRDTQRALQLIMDAVEVIRSMSTNEQRGRAWVTLMRPLHIADKDVQECLMEEAIEVVEDITDLLQKIDALWQLAAGIAGFRKRTRAEQLVDQTIAMTQSIADLRERIKVMLEGAKIVKFVSKDNQIKVLQKAKDSADLITDNEQKSSELLKIAENFLEAHEKDKARKILEETKEVARLISDPNIKDKILQAVAEKYVSLDEENQSKIQKKKYETKISLDVNVTTKVEVCYKLAEALLQVRQKDVALRLLIQAKERIQSLTDVNTKVKKLYELAEVFVTAEEKGIAIELLLEAEEEVRRFSDSSAKVTEFVEIAKRLHLAGHQRAVYVLTEARKEAQSSANSKAGSSVLRDIAITLAHVGEWSLAEEVARSIFDRKDQIYALCKVAKARVANEKDLATQLLDEAEELTQLLNNDKMLEDCLREIVVALSSAGDLARAENIVQLLRYYPSKVNALRAIAIEMSKRGDKEEAVRLLKNAEETIGSVSQDSKTKVNLLRMVAKNLIEIEEWEQAEKLARTAINVSTRNQSQRAKSLLVLMKIRAAQKKEVVPLLDELKKTVQSISDSDTKASIWHDVVEVLMTIEEEELALSQVQSFWYEAEARNDIIKFLPIVYPLLSLKPSIAISFVEAFDWVDSFLKGFVVENT